MQYRNLGQAGIKLSTVALGGWTTFGGSIQDQELAREIILGAYESGINFFDIADAYADGESERMMGKVLQELPRHTLVISSKLYWPMSDDINDRGLSRKHIMESIDKSLGRIGTDYLDLYFCHRFDAETPLEETVRAMDDLIHRGKILYWGTSEWSGAQIAQAVAIARQYNLYPPTMDQPGYNLTRRVHVERDVLPAARAHGMGLTTFSPLANGILTGKYDNGIPEDSRAADNKRLREKLSGDVVDRVKALKPIADDLGITRAQLAIAWILRHPEVTSVITGATKPRHVESNAQAAEVTLSEETVAEIDDLFPLE